MLTHTVSQSQFKDYIYYNKRNPKKYTIIMDIIIINW